MAKLTEKNVLDYRSGGDTIDDFAQKYMKEIKRLYDILNDLREHKESELPEAYAVKVEGDKLYIRNGANSTWLELCAVAPFGGLKTATVGMLASGTESARPAAGGAYDIYFALDTKRLFIWTGGAWQLLYSLNAGDLAGAEDLVRKSADVIAPSGVDVVTAGGKLVRTNEVGVLPVNISGTANKVGGQAFTFTQLADGQIPVYRESLGRFVNENKEAIGSAKALTIRQGETVLAVYDGNQAVTADLARTYGGYWTAETDIVQGECVRLITKPQFYLECQTAGKTGTRSPENDVTDEKLAQAGTIVDGSVVWRIWRLQLKNDVAGESARAAEADHAANADHATEADHAAEAAHATNADHAASADTAQQAQSAARAAKLVAARQVTLSGDVTGAASFDGSADVTIQTTAKKQELPFILQRNHAYFLGDIVRSEEIPSYLHLECIQAGITGSGSLGTHKTPNEQFQDGTVKWLTVDDRASVRLNTFQGIADLIYPVGSIYMSLNATNPNLLFGGTWQLLSNRFLVGAGPEFPPGSAGGESTHRLTVDEMPSHTHSGSTNSAGRHSHKIASLGTHSGGQKVADATTSTRTMYAGYISEEGEHSHGLSIYAAGGNAAHNNLPPYLAVYMWERTA